MGGGQGLEVQVADEEAEEPVVQVDFMFLRDKKDPEKKITVLCGKLANGGSGFAAQLWSKSAVDEYAVKSLLGFLRDEWLDSQQAIAPRS